MKPTWLEWLLEGDVAIQYLTRRDLLNETSDSLQAVQRRIALEGYGKRYLDLVDPATGLWAEGVYSPKFTSTHYTCLRLKNLGVPQDNAAYRRGAELLVEHLWRRPHQERRQFKQDMCVAAMVLNMAVYAGRSDNECAAILDYILDHTMQDGGWNCNWHKHPLPKQSSLHTTLSVLETFREIRQSSFTYRIDEIERAIPNAVEFLLSKRLFRSVRTGEIIHPTMLETPYPAGWKYDILRALEFCALQGVPYDPRMDEALDILEARIQPNGRVKAVKPQPGQMYFRMESTRADSRFNTLRTWIVMKQYRPARWNAAWTKENNA
ncbi:MAG: hypothetical protein MZU97_17160 [Bacillus subtilis]|nr:hypothetical protein [Bacillus subtilis]